jgi:SAM-dependent methyltransferase
MSRKFDQSFYDFIYGSIHHHEYAEHRARELIAIYGKGRFLEIGCACGILVKAMREQGADAWGIDISDYAIAQSCSPEFVRQADMRAIPFPDAQFDLIHSWAVFGYLDEAGTIEAIEECKRVGLRQYHTIDFQITPPYPYGYVSMRPRTWWDLRIQNDCI